MKKIFIILLSFSCCMLTACSLFDKENPTLNKISEDSIIVEANDSLHFDDYFDVSDNRTDREDILIETTIDSSVLGLQTVEISAIDKAKNKTSIQTEIEVQDTISPDVTLNGDKHIVLMYGDVYDEQGVSVKDNYDTTCNVTISGDSDAFVVGTNKLTYTVTDSSQNQASVTRTIEVIDTTAPVINTDNIPRNLILSETLPDLYAIDNADGEIPISISGEIDYCKPGIYTLELSAEDSSGNLTTDHIKVKISPIELDFPIGLHAKIKEFSTDFEYYFWVDNPVINIMVEFYNPTDETIAFDPHFWWVNDAYGNDSVYNSFLATYIEFQEIPAHTLVEEVYTIAFLRDAEDFYNCNEMRFTVTSDDITYVGPDIENRFEFSFQDLFNSSITK